MFNTVAIKIVRKPIYRGKLRNEFQFIVTNPFPGAINPMFDKPIVDINNPMPIAIPNFMLSGTEFIMSSLILPIENIMKRIPLNRTDIKAK